jgi:hypothetical protein
MRRLHFSVFTAFLSVGVGTTPLFLSTVHAAPSSDYEKASALLHLRVPLKITEAGKVEADVEKWKVEKDAEGTELFSLKSGNETRVAAMKTDDGQLDSLTTFTLSGEAKAETSASLFFKKGKSIAFTNCVDGAEKNSIGRICVTATPKLCQNLKKNEGIDPETLKEMDLFEMRALAAILTLRGSDHQLENVVRTGNRLGLKSALQTTKGLIYALVKKEKESTERVPAAAPGAASSATAASTQAILDKSIPRLKEACLAL